MVSYFSRRWLSQKLPSTRSDRALRNRRTFKPTLETLEDRWMLSTIHWTNPAGGNWGVAGNWDLNRMPSAGDDVVIPTLGSGISITHSTGTDTVQSVTSGTNLILSSPGTLTASSTLQVSSGSALTFQGGTLANARVVNGSLLVFTNSGGIMSGVTVNGDMDLSRQQGAGVRVLGGLVLNGTMSLGNAAGSVYGYVAFGDTGAPAGSLTGNATVVFGGEGGGDDSLRNDSTLTGAAGTLTLGPTVTVHGKNGSVYSSSSTGSVVNEGTISADTAGGTLTIGNAGSAFTNQGAISAVAGATLGLYGSLTLQTRIAVMAGATLGLNGSITLAGLGMIDRRGATINLGGTLDLGGGTLLLDTAGGAWNLTGGTIANGTITESGGVLLGFTNTRGGTLRSVTLNGDMDLSRQQGAGVRVLGGLVLNGTMSLGDAAGNTFGGVYFGDAGAPAGSLTGNATVVFGTEFRAGNSFIENDSTLTGTAGTLTLGPAVTVHGKNGSVYSNVSTGSLVNQGTISADTAGGTISLGNAGSAFTNQGAISAAAGATLGLYGSLTLQTRVTVMAGATLALNGSITLAGLGMIDRRGATINLSGMVDLGGGTLLLDAVGGVWNLTGGTIANGTINESGGALLGFTSSAGVLRGVTVNGEMDLSRQQVASVRVFGGLVLNGTMSLGNAAGNTSGSVYFGDTGAAAGSLTGNATVVFGGAGPESNLIENDSNLAGTQGTLTLGPRVTIHGKNGAIYSSYYGNGSLVNQGTVSADTAGGTIAIGGSIPLGNAAFTNQGAISAVAGATLGLYGSLTLQTRIAVMAGATLALNGSITLAGLGMIDRRGATINLGGTLDLGGGTLLLDTAGGAWSLTGGTIANGTINESGGVLLGFTNTRGGTLRSVTLNGDMDLSRQQGAGVRVLGGLVLNGTMSLGDVAGNTFGGVYFGDAGAPAGSLTGNATVVFGTEYRAGTSFIENDSTLTGAAGTLTLGPAVTVRGKNGSVYSNVSTGSLVNQGTISADTAGGTISLGNAGSTFTDQGTITASNGGTIVLPNSSLQIDGLAVVRVAPNSSLTVNGSLLGNTQNTGLFKPQGTITLNGGTVTAPLRLEAMSADQGGVPGGFNNNFAYGTMILGNSSYVKLVDQSHTAGSAVYANALVVPTGSTLDLNGLHLYVRLAQVAGTIMGGSITQIPSGGPLTVGSPTPGGIAMAGHLDTWTFFGRRGTSIAVALDPGSGMPGGPIGPTTLQWAQVQLRDPSGQVLAMASSTTAGAVVTLTRVPPLPADGIYTIAVQAATGHESNTGNYVVAAYDVTSSIQSLSVNQTITGTVATPYSTAQWNFSATANTQVQFNLLAASTHGLAFSLVGPNGFTGFMDLPGSSPLVTLPTSGTYTLIAQGTSAVIGNFSFVVAQTTVTPLALGTPYNGIFAASGQAQLFQVTVPPEKVLSFQLSDPTAADRTELYAEFGNPPTRAAYGYRFASPGNNQSLLVPSASAGPWYVLVYSESTPHGGAFTLSATGLPTKLAAVTPNQAGSSPATLTFTGAGFVAGTTVTLVAIDGITTYAPSGFSIDSFTQITATFPANLPAGTYSARVTAGGSSDTLPGAFTLTAGGMAHLQTDLVLPSALGRHAPATFYVKYANTGTVAMPAPLLVLSNPNDDRPLLTLDQSLVTNGFWISNGTSIIPDGFSTSISYLASGKTPGVLQAGESVTVPVYYAGLQQPWNFSHTTIPFNLGVVYTTDTAAIDWNSLKASLQPSWISSGAWDPIYNAVVAQAGGTSGGYVQMLDNNAQYLGRLGESVTDVGQLWNFSILQANGLNPISTLASAVDASMVTPGVSLSFGRSFGETINSRYQMGAFGRGWSVPWQMALSTLADGTVVITADGGNQFRYQPDSRFSGRYFSAAGDMNMLMGSAGGTFVWKQTDGSTTHFRADGKLDYVQDTNGNKITAGYNASGQLTNLTHSSGQSLLIAYNAAGLIHTITDSAGRQTVYTYDTANQHLMTVQAPGGTTQYTYSVGNGAAKEHALTSIQFPDGSHLYYTYESLGRLASTSRDGNAERVVYTYDEPGEVTGTDLLGDASRTFYDNRGLPIKSQDALGYITVVSYDPATLLVSQITDPSGQSQTFTYDAMGNLASSTDQLGHKTFYTHGIDNRLTSLTDANGNKTVYAYDPAGNLLSTTYANGLVELTTYDPLGNPMSFTNRRGQAVSYMYNAAGQVTKETFPDATHTDFMYDEHGNLKTATDASGTITFSYQSDYLKRVDYPGGRFLDFTLDPNSGRRMAMVDQTGFTVNYHYDTAGRLWYLTDGSNNRIVTYTYDPAGRLSRKDNGNGTYTTYQYDANGNVLHLINYAPGGAVNSRFDYTYNALGLRTTMATVDGTWTYSYDGTGQLTHAVFASTNHDVPNQDLVYNYDAVGNRTSTVINGVTTAYVANNLNEYASVGGVTQMYDADGNLLSDGTNRYAYDVLGRLISVTTPTGTTGYNYDAMGNRSASTTNGQVTQYLNDPAGLPNVVDELDGSGAVIAHSTYGLGLASRVINGRSYYYDFDAVGNTAGLTNTGGTYANSYSYLPFGGRLSVNTAISNPFEFSGEFDVQSEVSGIQYMRARYYSPSSSRFISVDPIRLASGEINFYRYGLNDPVSVVDPSGAVPLPFKRRFLRFVGRTLGSACADAISECIGLGSESSAILRAGFGAAGSFTGQMFYLAGYSQIPNGAYNFGLWLGTKYPDEIADTVLAARDFFDVPPPPGYAYAKIGIPPTPNVPANDQNRGNCPVPAATDPNDKLGPVGFGNPHFVQSGKFLPYRIDFENAMTATAPAQAVTITDQLAPTLDLTTFRLTEISFGDTILTIPADTQHYQTTVSMTYNRRTFDVLIEAGIHSDSGVVYAIFQSIDPTTSLPPDVLTGFLPPEDGTGRGMGHISYTIQPRAGLPTGTQIRNVALVTFDQNDAIATDQIDEHDPSKGTDPNKEALVTIDAGPPTSSVNPLPAQSPPTFLVTWAGADEAGGSGVAFFDIYVSDNNGPFRLWLAQTTRNQAAFTGVFGHTYGFYSVATDNVGNREATPSMAQSTTVVSNAGTATHFQVVPTGHAFVAGTPFSIMVRVLDDGGNLVPGYTGTVHFASTDPQAAIPADYTFTAADAGVHAFTVTLFTAGSQAVTAGDALDNLTGQAGVVNEFATPTASSGPSGITYGPDGNVWFVETNIGKIARIAPDGTMTEFALPSSGSRPLGITTGPDGNLWFTEFNANKIGMISPDGSTIMEFPLPTLNSGPEGIVAGPDGNLWFTEYSAGQIGMISPDGSTIMEFALPTSGSGPMEITVGPDGNLWFTEFLADQIGMISTDGSILNEFALPTPNSGPMGIAAGSDGNLWFTEFNANQVGSISPDGSTIIESAIGTVDSGPQGIVAAPDGNLWFTEANANQSGQITPSAGTVGGFNEFPIPAAGSVPVGITADASDNIWFTESQAGAIGELIPVITVTAAPTDHFVIIAPASVPAGMPFDITVLAMDPYGNIDTNCRGTIRFTTTDPNSGVVLPADYTFQPGDGGVVTFVDGVTLITPGDQSITVTDVDTGLLTGSITATVTAGPGPFSGHGRKPDGRAFSGVGLRSWAVDPRRPEVPALTAGPMGALRADEARNLAGARADSFWIGLGKSEEASRPILLPRSAAALADDVWLGAFHGLWSPFESLLESRWEDGERA